jgi:large subunit ribosomal protein L4
MAIVKQYNAELLSASDRDVDIEAISSKVTRQLIHDACVMYHANQRVGTMRTKSRSEVAGTTAKMYRQKGTGRARAGSRRSPVRRGGGHAFAKRPRDFSYSLPKKSLRVAMRMSLRLKIEAGDVVSLQSLDLPELKTKHVVRALRAIGADSKSCLLVTAEVDKNLHRCARNIDGVTVMPVSDVNASHLMRHRVVVFVAGALDMLVG